MFNFLKKKKLVKKLESPVASERKESAEELIKINWKPSNNIEKANFYCALEKWSELKLLGKESTNSLINALVDEKTRIPARKLIIELNKDIDGELKKSLSNILNENLEGLKDDKRIKEIISIFKDIGNPKFTSSLLGILFTKSYTNECVDAIKSFGIEALDELISVLSSGIHLKKEVNGKIIEVDITNVDKGLLMVSELIANGDSSLSQTLYETKGINLDAQGARNIISYNKLAQDYIILISSIIVEMGSPAIGKVEKLLDSKRPIIKEAAEKILLKIKK